MSSAWMVAPDSTSNDGAGVRLQMFHFIVPDPKLCSPREIRFASLSTARAKPMTDGWVGMRRSNPMHFIYRAMLVLAFLSPVAVAAAPAAAAAPRHYDCSKPGNANKAACKTSAAAPATKAAPAGTTIARAASTTGRHYDCAKPGNANKAACRTAAGQVPTGKSPRAAKTTTASRSTTTDCTKWYNKMRAACRASSSSPPPRTAAAPAPRPAAAPARRPAATTRGNGESVNNNAAGAIAQCKDGRYSHAAHLSGACSRHGGVAKRL